MTLFLFPMLRSLIHLRDTILEILRQCSDSNTIIIDGEGSTPQSSEHKTQSAIHVSWQNMAQDGHLNTLEPPKD